MKLIHFEYLNKVRSFVVKSDVEAALYCKFFRITGLLKAEMLKSFSVKDVVRFGRQYAAEIQKTRQCKIRAYLKF